MRINQLVCYLQERSLIFSVYSRVSWAGEMEHLLKRRSLVEGHLELVH